MSSSHFFLILALILATVLSPVFTAPVPVPEDAVTPELEKRVMHSGVGTYFEPGLGACGWVSMMHRLATPASCLDLVCIRYRTMESMI